MRGLFKSKKFRFYRRDPTGKVMKRWAAPGIDIKANVVCRKCNETWMSNIENKHAKPAMTDLILGKPVEINQERANSIALFAFKTAILADQMSSGEFFCKRHPWAVWTRCSWVGMMTLVGTKVSVHEGISGHFETVTKRS